MAASTSFTVTGSKGHHTWTITLNETSVNNTDNTSTMSISLKMASTTYTWSGWGDKLQYRLRVTLDGDTDTVYYNSGWKNAPNHYPNADSNLKWITDATFTVGHADNGTRTVRAYYEFKDSAGQSYTPGAASGNKALELTSIARYTNINSFWATAVYEQTASFSWSTSDSCDAIQYRLNSGSWTATTLSSATSGSFSISGLSTYTSYSIQIRCKRTDSQLWTESSTVSFTTYRYPYIQSVSNTLRNIGDSYTLNIYNPLGRTYNVIMKQNSFTGTTLFSQNGQTTTSFTFTPNASTLYASIPYAQQGTAVVYCVCTSPTNDPSSVDHNTGVSSYKTLNYQTVYSVCKPTWPSGSTITYTDTNTTVRNLLGTSSYALVQNQSTPYLTIPTASQQSSAAGIDHYEVQFGSLRQNSSSSGRVDFPGPITTSSNITASVVAIDSRGYSSDTKSITIEVLPWSKPTIVLNTLQRRNNYGETVDLKVTRTSYSSVNGKNEARLSLTYSYTGATSGSGTLTSGTTTTLTGINNDSVYTFNIRSQDAFSDETTSYRLEKGTFLLMLDSSKLGVGINAFPSGTGLYGEVGHLESTTSTGFWGEVRSKAAVFNNVTTANKFNALATQKTDSGAWTMGSLTGNNNLYFSYCTDSAYGGSGTNPTKNVILDTEGRINTIPMVYSGTSSPSSSVGRDGDIYIIYN